jgi:sodium transport system permease protein
MSTLAGTRQRHLRSIFIVLAKEVRENLRDRRTLVSAFVTGPLLGPFFFVMLIGVMVNQQLDKATQSLPVPVIGATYAPHVVDALKAGGIEPQPAVADPARAVRDQDADVVVRIAPDYPQAWRRGEPVQVEVFFDSSRRDAATAVERVTQLIDGYARQQAAMRLVARGMSPALATPVVVARRDQATPQARAVLLLNILPYFFVLTILMGGMYLAIDLTAGERERQSLEPLFANPVPRWQILAGKLLAIAAFSLSSLFLCLLVFAFVGRLVPADKLGMEVDLGWHFAAFVLLLQVPMVALFAALQSLVAAFAKSFREAQTYLSLLMMVPIIPSVLLMAMPVKPQSWMYLVPLLGQHLGILDLLRGGEVGAAHLGLCLAGTSRAALVAVLVTVHLYRSEKLAISA